MRKRITFGLLLSLVVGICIGALGVRLVYANFSKSINVTSGINLQINGNKFIPKDANGKVVDVFVYNGTTYVPIRAVSEAFNKKVDWDEKTNTVVINDSNFVSSKDDTKATEQAVDQTMAEERKVSNKASENKTRQSGLMLEYTGAAWNEELEETLKDVDFTQYGFDKENPTLIKDVNSMFVLANKANHFPEDFVPVDLVSPKTRYAGGGDRNKMRQIAADALDELVAGAMQAGHDIKNVSAYRSIAYQKILFDNYAANDGIAAANKYSSKPSFSEHHTGLCADVSSPSMSFGLGQEYIDTAEGAWLAQNAHQYGFIIRYPLNKEYITGYTYEPWHIRYLGIPLATYLYENELTFEEFLALQVGKTPAEIKYQDF